jgi:hypothetical protein
MTDQVRIARAMKLMAMKTAASLRIRSRKHLIIKSPSKKPRNLVRSHFPRLRQRQRLTPPHRHQLLCSTMARPVPTSASIPASTEDEAVAEASEAGVAVDFIETATVAEVAVDSIETVMVAEAAASEAEAAVALAAEMVVDVEDSREAEEGEEEVVAVAGAVAASEAVEEPSEAVGADSTWIDELFKLHSLMTHSSSSFPLLCNRFHYYIVIVL